MTIYVDDMAMQADVYNPWTGKIVKSTWSPLISNHVDPEELHEFAVQRLGLKREYFQPGEHSAYGDHYDVTANKRLRAIRCGAVRISSDQLAEIIRAKRQLLSGQPDTLTL